MDTLTILKLSATISTGVFGICALIGEKKNKEGKMTRWGQISLCGVIVSMIIAILSQMTETKKAQRAAEARDQETRRMLMEVRRAVHPLMPAKGMEVRFSLRIPLNHQALTPYRMRIMKVMEDLKQNPSEIGKLSHTHIRTLTSMDNGTEEFFGLYFSEGSPVTPSSEDGINLQKVFENIGIDCRIYDTSLPSKNNDVGGIRLTASLAKAELSYEIDAKAEELWIRTNMIDIGLHGSWGTDGKIVSLDDLADKTLLITPLDGDFGKDDEINLRNDLYAQIELESFEFSAANRHFGIGSLRKKENSGWPEYQYRFPADLLEQDGFLQN